MGALFLLSYYTDVAGVGAAAAGTMLLLVRVLTPLLMSRRGVLLTALIRVGENSVLSCFSAQHL